MLYEGDSRSNRTEISNEYNQISMKIRHKEAERLIDWNYLLYYSRCQAEQKETLKYSKWLRRMLTLNQIKV